MATLESEKCLRCSTYFVWAGNFQPDLITMYKYSIIWTTRLNLDLHKTNLIFIKSAYAASILPKLKKSTWIEHMSLGGLKSFLRRSLTSWKLIYIYPVTMKCRDNIPHSRHIRWQCQSLSRNINHIQESRIEVLLSLISLFEVLPAGFLFWLLLMLQRCSEPFFRLFAAW